MTEMAVSDTEEAYHEQREYHTFDRNTESCPEDKRLSSYLVSRGCEIDPLLQQLLGIGDKQILVRMLHVQLGRELVSLIISIFALSDPEMLGEFGHHSHCR